MIIAENETPQPAAFISAKCKQVDRPPMPKEQIRQLTTGVDYVVAIVDDFILKDIDIIPLQNQQYQTHMVFTYFFGWELHQKMY